MECKKFDIRSDIQTKVESKNKCTDATNMHHEKLKEVQRTVQMSMNQSSKTLLLFIKVQLEYFLYVCVFASSVFLSFFHVFKGTFHICLIPLFVYTYIKTNKIL